MAKLPFRYALDANDDPVSGAGFYLFDAGTTNAVTMYTDSALTTPHTTPVVASAAGVFAAIYVASGTYKIDIRDTGGSSLPGYPEDNVATLDLTASGFAALSVAATRANLTSGTAATYTTPTNCKAIFVECWGAGGGGGNADGQGASETAMGGVGGAGGYCSKMIASPAASYTYTVGAGGAGGTGTGANNGSGGTATTFSGGGGISLSAGGGGGGTGHVGISGSATIAGGAGGTSSGGDINITGETRGFSTVVNGLPGFGPNGGSTSIGSGGRSVNASGSAADGNGYGSGGGGGVAIQVTTDVDGGDGAGGLIIITEYY